jgi:hypothetical protein
MPKFPPLIGIAILAAFLAGPARAQETVTMDQASRDDTALRDQFWGIFEPGADRGRAQTRSPGDSVMLSSRIYPTEYPGMCRQDNTTLLFAPAQDGVREPGNATPMRAYGVDNTPYYRFYRAPGSGAPDFDDPWPGGVWNGPCSHLVLDREFFKAPDEETAFEGYRSVLAARSAVTSRRVRVGRCRPPRDRERFCRGIFADTAPPVLQSIERCDARPNTACFVAEMGGWIHIRIVVAQDGEGYGDDTAIPMLNARAAGRVLSVDVDFDHTSGGLSVD